MHRLVLSVVLLSACTVESTDAFRSICLTDTTVTATFALCESSSGRTLRDAEISCSAGPDNTLNVSGSASLSVGMSGTDDCISITQSCELPDGLDASQPITVASSSVNGTLFEGACVQSSDAPVDRWSVDTVASACLNGDALTVDFGVCLSSSCDTLVASVCEVTGTADALLVSGEATIDSLSGDLACTDDCNPATATCTLPKDVDTNKGITLVGANKTLFDGDCTSVGLP